MTGVQTCALPIFEQRVKGLLSEVKAAGNVILFIDEIHTITSAG